MISQNTSLYGILGHPVSHSKSPLMHNSAFLHDSIDAVYLAFDVLPENLKDVIKGFMKVKSCKGFNITVPHKIEIIQFLDELDETAKTIGSVNTIKNDNGIWKGFNTDWYGVYQTLIENKIPLDSNVLILGAGGASPAVIYGLKKYGINQISITNRTESTAMEIAKKTNISSISFELLNKVTSSYNFIINTTTLTFDLLLKEFNEETVYFDLKYYTDFNHKNIEYIDGKTMLLHQAAKSYEIWINQIAPIAIMKESLK